MRFLCFPQFCIHIFVQYYFVFVFCNKNAFCTGVQKALEHLNIDKEHSYAFGDGLNDLEMIKYAGHGIAMKNAVKELKDVADEVIGHVDENGLEEYLKTID